MCYAHLYLTVWKKSMDWFELSESLTDGSAQINYLMAKQWNWFAFSGSCLALSSDMCCLSQLWLPQLTTIEWLVKEIDLFTVLEAESPNSRCWQDWFPSRLLFLTCGWLPSCSVFTWLSLCAQKMSLCVQISSSYKKTRLGPTLMIPIFI